MALNLSNIRPAQGSTKDNKRVGRGGKRGTYSGRGLKGQRARSGGRSGTKRRGMRQLIERTHKLKGFKSIHAKPAIVSLSELNEKFKDGSKVNPKVILKEKLVDNIQSGVKILSNGQIKVKLNISGCTVSKTAKMAIEKAGGKIIEPLNKKTEAKEKEKKNK